MALEKSLNLWPFGLSHLICKMGSRLQCFEALRYLGFSGKVMRFALFGAPFDQGRVMEENAVKPAPAQRAFDLTF